MKWFVLEWNGLDDSIGLYEWPTEKADIAEVWEEVRESLHNFSNVLVMDEQRLNKFFKAVEAFAAHMKRGEQDNG